MDDLKKLVEKIDSKLDKVDERLGYIDVTLVRQNGELEHHIYRTDLNEKHLAIIESELKPVKIHVERVNFFFKLVGMGCTGLGLLIGLSKLLLQCVF